MLRKISLLMLLVLMFGLMIAGPASADAPNFSPAIYGDGVAWGTKGLADLPAPNDHNAQSFDKLFQFTNGAAGQLPVAEAAPGNPNYNGGRWNAQSVTWTAAGLAAHDPLPVLTSYDEVMFHYNLGHLSITSANSYFECPLLPVK